MKRLFTFFILLALSLTLAFAQSNIDLVNTPDDYYINLEKRDKNTRLHYGQFYTCHGYRFKAYQDKVYYKKADESRVRIFKGSGRLAVKAFVNEICGKPRIKPYDNYELIEGQDYTSWQRPRARLVKN